MVPSQVSLVRAVAQSCGLDVAGVGSNDPQIAKECASIMHTSVVDDLRALLGSDKSTGQNDLVWLAHTGDQSPSQIELRSIQLAADRGVIVASCDPIPESVFQLPSDRHSQYPWQNTTTGRPLLSVGPTINRMISTHVQPTHLEDIGSIQSISIDIGTRTGDNSMRSLLFAACIALGEYLDTIEWVMCANAPGHCVASCKSVLGQIGSITISNRLGEWVWRCLLAGEHGHILLNGNECRRVIESGDVETLSATPAPPRTSHAESDKTLFGHSNADTLGVDLMSSFLRHAITSQMEMMLPAGAPTDVGGALALMHAMHLSAKTGQPETPRGICTTTGH